MRGAVIGPVSSITRARSPVLSGSTYLVSLSTWKTHIPSHSSVDIAVSTGADNDEKRARTLIEKKTVLNLLEGFA